MLRNLSGAKKSFIYLAIIVLMTGLLTTTHVQSAQAGHFPDYLSKWFPQWFAEKDTGPKPQDTLQAPFATPEETAPVQENNLGLKYDDQVAEAKKLDTPHRQPEQIREWLIHHISEMMTFTPSEYNTHMAYLETFMSEGATKDFNNFMAKTNILGYLEVKEMRINSYIEDMPILRNQAPLNGRYRWLFQVPLNMTFIPLAMENYDDKDQKTSNERILIEVQVGRIPFKDAGSNLVDGNMSTDHGIRIETWAVKPNKK